MILLQLQNVIKKREREDGYCLCIKSFAINKGEYIAVTGSSGCGKSTMLDIIGMILQPEQAGFFEFYPEQQKFNIAELWRLKKLDAMAYIRRHYIGYVLQTGELLPYLTVKENALLTANSAKKENPEDRVKWLLDRLQIFHLANAMPATLSIGERQRAAIARALASAPELLLADEPTAALDPYLSQSVMELFLSIVQETKTSVIVVSHDINLVREFDFKIETIKVRRDGEQVIAELDQQRNTKQEKKS